VDRGHAPAGPLERPCAERRGEAAVGASGRDTPGGEAGLRARVVERGPLLAALRRVQQTGGRPGSDGRIVAELPGALGEQWRQSRAARLAGTSRPQAVKRVAIPQPGGGVRILGMPTGRDRFLQQARRQVLPPAWATPGADGSEGGRRGRSAHPAIARAQRDVRAGDSGVVALDVETFVARVNHDTRMRLGKKRAADRRVLPRRARDLKAGVRTEAALEATGEGTPPGGPGRPCEPIYGETVWTRRWSGGATGAYGTRMRATSTCRADRRGSACWPGCRGSWHVG
jgi:RNA-directed DNA polymerase